MQVGGYTHLKPWRIGELCSDPRGASASSVMTVAACPGGEDPVCRLGRASRFDP
jgi:hypothetical protein